MAKKRKNKSAVPDTPGMAVGGSGRLSTDISDAENGYIVNVSGETGGRKPSYFSKRYIAADRPEALRIASSCLAGGRTKGAKKKSGGKKKIALKRG
jgi:hypothetical protein